MTGVLSFVILSAACFIVWSEGTEQMSLTQGVCVDWVDLVWKLMVLDEARPEASKTDMDRLIIFMDNDGDQQLSSAEFNLVWECTMMTHEDTRRVFNMMAGKANDNQRDVITTGDVDALWADTFNKAGSEFITKPHFARAWTEIASRLPDKGCYDPAEHMNGYMSELCSILTESAW